jgi:hypothetical protein
MILSLFLSSKEKKNKTKILVLSLYLKEANKPGHEQLQDGFLFV